MNKFELNKENFLLYAAKNYNNSSCVSLKEFHGDLKRFKYIKRLLGKYKKNGELSERLLLNHFILLRNVFGDAMIPMLFYKFEKEYWSEIKTFLVFLNYLQDNYQINDNVNESSVSLDTYIIEKLRQI